MVVYQKQLMLDISVKPERRTLHFTPTDDLGQVFTRRWVVDLILDLVGYTEDRDLTSLTALEPACGEGAFLGPIIDRLMASCARYGREPSDLSEVNVERARKLAATRLLDSGVTTADAEHLSRSWIREGDFLLVEEVDHADFVLGNPPYVRLENVTTARTAAYRAACPTMTGRSDVYIGFIERGLRLLNEGGALGFIVADRWMHNQYGASLRRFIASGFSMDATIEMHDADAFEDQVSAYPAITVITRRPQGRAVLATTDRAFSSRAASRLRSWAVGGRTGATEGRGFRAARLDTWFPGGELWPSGEPDRLAILSDLEKRFPPLEDPATGTRVGIGVATGADDVYITGEEAPVEKERLLPLVMASDITSGRVEWSGSFLVNPWEDGRLVDLRGYPRLGSYLNDHKGRLLARHVSKRKPASWYRTIDRVHPGLRERPKLLLPDIKASSHPVLDEGQFYPHHNLYFVTSEQWDLRILGGLLLSEVANLFIGAYCVKMRGGCYRFQAQYLRRIRFPRPTSIERGHGRALIRAFEDRDVRAATSVAVEVCGIDPLPGWC